MTRALLLTVAAVAIVMTPFFGGESVPLAELFDPSSAGHRIFFELRLPRLLLLVLGGGTLAMLGGTYQTIFHNVLADPYVLGISSATTLGVALSEIVLQAAPYSPLQVAIGCAFALVATAVLVAAGASRMGRQMERIVLFGMALNFVLSSALFLALSYHFQHIGGGSLRWIFGQIPWVSAREAIGFAALALPLATALPLFARRLDALSLGDAVARTMGIDPTRVRLFFIALTSMLLALVVCFTGSVGFVGLVVPHAVRLGLRPRSARELLLFSFVLGGAFLGLSDVLSRVLLPPFEFPIGVLTTLLGGPAFLFLLWRRP